MKPYTEPQDSSDDAKLKRVMTELSVALWSLDAADATSAKYQQRQGCKYAQAAHDSALRRLPHLVLTPSAEEIIKGTLDQIRTRLQGFGVSLDKSA